MKILVRAFALSATLSALALPAFAGLFQVDPALSPPTEKSSTPPGKEAPAPAVKLGFVDVRAVATGSEAGKAATADLKAKAEKFQAKFREKEKQLEKMKAMIEAKAASMPPEKRAAKAKEFQKKVDELREMARSAEKELQAREEELTGKILETIGKVVGDYGKKEGYTVISGKRDLLYADPTLSPRDLTSEILSLVNAEKAK
jgi:outer membrane protein